MAKTVHITEDRQLQIVSLAETVADSAQHVKRTDLDAIIKRNEIRLSYARFQESFDGLLEYNNRNYHIFCNELTGNAQGTPRSRFTIAHELGHYFIDEHRLALGTHSMPSPGEGAKSDDLIEREADLFASHLLLPTTAFRRAIKTSPGGMVGILSIAEGFGSSVKCTAIRFVSDDSSSAALVFRSWNGEIVWRWFSRSAWNAGFRSLKPVPIQDSATARTLANRDEHSSIIEESAAPASYLFALSDGAYYHEVFKEESMGLGEYGVLTLLSAVNGFLPPLAEVLDKRIRV